LRLAALGHPWYNSLWLRLAALRLLSFFAANSTQVPFHGDQDFTVEMQF
jgi:hypothetical protein